MSRSKRGILFTILGGVFWGLSGVCGQYLFSEKGLNAEWLVTMRLVLAGIIMIILTISRQKNVKDVFEIWTDKRDVIRLIAFGLLGMAACQFTYFITIEESNASTATILQYTAPVLIMVFMALKNKKIPESKELISLVFVVVGTFFIVTHGNIHSLAISKAALFWGITSAFTVVVYNLMPVKLMNKYGTVPVLGWGMIIGGILMTVITKPWIIPGIWDMGTWLAFVTVIIGGTVLSFSLYLEGVRLIGASKASLFASSEPLTSTVLTALIMKVAFTGMDILGLVFILFGVTFLSVTKKSDNISG